MGERKTGQPLQGEKKSDQSVDEGENGGHFEMKIPVLAVLSKVNLYNFNCSCMGLLLRCRGL